MSILDMYRNSAQQKRTQIANFHNEKAKVQQKIADLSGRIQRASESALRTKSLSTIKSKSQEVDRYNKQVVTEQKKIANIELKIVNKQKELNRDEHRINTENLKEMKKREQEQKKLEQERKKRMVNVDNTLHKHNKLHLETKTTLKEIQKIPEKIVVLFFAANPLDQAELRLDEEARAISNMIKKAKHRDAVKFETCWAVQTIDILQALNEFKPTIVHFSGHGSDQDQIVFQDELGNAKPVSKEAIVQTMKASSDNLRMVFFNTCFSKNQAGSIVKHIESAIGMNTSIGDEAARVFSSQFYSSISFGLSVQKAFDQAKAILMLESIAEENTPELFIQEGLSAESLILVEPK
jgi:hypothetical protein